MMVQQLQHHVNKKIIIMKNLYMKLLSTLCFLVITISCKAQIYPLKTDYTEISQNSYLKDINNELDAFIGTYRTQFQGNEITLYLTKEIQRYFERGNYKFYNDVISVKYTIKSLNGTVLQDTQSMNIPLQQIRHTIYSRWTEYGNKLLLYYGGTNCGVGWGSIILTKIDASQLLWEYTPNDIIIDSNKCPSGTDINIYLPQTKDLIFTKQ